jgi:tRNA pseudouridine55 synthase
VTNGLLLVDKPEGLTSAGVIRALKGALGSTKVGHLGTLDPFASGLLPLCLGEATKVARYLLVEDKAYTGSIRLGVETDTLDRTGTPTANAAVPPSEALRLVDVTAAYTGAIEQVPPMYSALKRDGVPLYKLARRGVSVDRAARSVVIRSLVLTLVAPDQMDVTVECSKGTYVRVLAADIARALGTVGHLAALRRTGVGAFRVEDAWGLARLQGTPREQWPVISVRRALAGLEAFVMVDELLCRLRRGQQGALRELPRGRSGQVAVVVPDGGDEVEAVIEVAPDGGWRVVRMLGASPLQG